MNRMMEFICNFLSDFELYILFSIWTWYADIYWARNSDARYDGNKLCGGYCHCSPHFAGPLHLSPDAFPIREFSGTNGENIWMIYSIHPKIHHSYSKIITKQFFLGDR